MTPYDRQMEELIERVPSGDLSSLIVLRVIAANAAPGEWMRIDRLVDEVRHEYSLRSSDGAGVTVSPQWEATPASEDGMADYIRDHVVSRWTAEGVLEARSDGPAEPDAGPDRAADAVRIAPDLHFDRDSLLGEIDLRIAGITAGADTSIAASHADRALDPPSELIAEGHSTLSASGLVKIYRKRRVVNDVAVQVSQGEIVGLLGPNGAGKTTTFYMMVGLIAPDGGRVALGDEDVTHVPMFRRARKGVGYLAQEPSVFRKLTVEENVLAILQMLGLPRREQRERLEMLLDELGIKHLRKSKAYSLSGGERRRLEITRALVGRPKFMLLDEPFAGVDPIAVHDIQQIVSDLRRRNIGVLISDHNVEQTLDIVDRAYIMYDGRVRVSGTVSELVWNDEVAEIYLGPTLTARMRQRYSYPE